VSEQQLDQWAAIAQEAAESGDFDTAIINFRKARVSAEVPCQAMWYAGAEMVATNAKSTGSIETYQEELQRMDEGLPCMPW
jgi:hypothetical protein